MHFHCSPITCSFIKINANNAAMGDDRPVIKSSINLHYSQLLSPQLHSSFCIIREAKVHITRNKAIVMITTTHSAGPQQEWAFTQATSWNSLKSLPAYSWILQCKFGRKKSWSYINYNCQAFDSRETSRELAPNAHSKNQWSNWQSCIVSFSQYSYLFTWMDDLLAMPR